MILQQQAPADLILHSRSISIHGAEAALVEVTVHNRTGEAWHPDEADPVYISYHWIDERGEWLPYDGLRTPFTMALVSDKQLQLAVRIHPPAVPGQYRLVLDLMREKEGWFKLDQILSVEIRPVTARRATLVIDKYRASDTIGANVRHKLALLRKWGFAPLVLTHRIDPDLPLADQASAVEVKPDDILHSDPNHAWVSDHFWQSQLYLFEYAGPYPLLDLIRVAPNSPAILDYHRDAPAHGRNPVTAHDLGSETGALGLVAYADYAIAHGEDARRKLLATGLIAAERVKVMHYGVPIDRVPPRDQSEVAPQHPISHGPMLLYVGEMDGDARIDMLVRMVARVHEEYPDVRLVLIDADSSAPHRTMDVTTRALITELGVDDNIRFVGAESYDALPAYYSVCDAFVMPSAHEGFYVPVAEAMAARKPVVAPRAGALPRLVGDAGLLFEPGNVEEFAEHVLAVLRSKMVAGGWAGRSPAAYAVEGN